MPEKSTGEITYFFEERRATDSSFLPFPLFLESSHQAETTLLNKTQRTLTILPFSPQPFSYHIQRHLKNISPLLFLRARHPSGS